MASNIQTLDDVERLLKSKQGRELNTIHECISALVDLMKSQNQEINKLLTQAYFDSAYNSLWAKLENLETSTKNDLGKVDVKLDAVETKLDAVADHMGRIEEHLGIAPDPEDS